jgi:uncharacterized small protein (DUF1192 family)
MTRRPPKKFVFTQGKDKPMYSNAQKPIIIAGSGDFELWTEKALAQRRAAKTAREQRDSGATLELGQPQELEERMARATAEAERIEAALDAYTKERQAGETYKA